MLDLNSVFLRLFLGKYLVQENQRQGATPTKQQRNVENYS